MLVGRSVNGTFEWVSLLCIFLCSITILNVLVNNERNYEWLGRGLLLISGLFSSALKTRRQKYRVIYDPWYVLSKEFSSEWLINRKRSLTFLRSSSVQWRDSFCDTRFRIAIPNLAFAARDTLGDSCDSLLDSGGETILSYDGTYEKSTSRVRCWKLIGATCKLSPRLLAARLTEILHEIPVDRIFNWARSKPSAHEVERLKISAIRIIVSLWHEMHRQVRKNNERRRII